MLNVLSGTGGTVCSIKLLRSTHHGKSWLCLGEEHSFPPSVPPAAPRAPGAGSSVLRVNAIDVCVVLELESEAGAERWGQPVTPPCSDLPLFCPMPSHG